jgi:hypothetical protein
VCWQWRLSVRRMSTEGCRSVGLQAAPRLLPLAMLSARMAAFQLLRLVAGAGSWVTAVTVAGPAGGLAGC